MGSDSCSEEEGGGFLRERTVFYKHVSVSPEGLVRVQIVGPQP